MERSTFTWEGKPYRSKQKVFCRKRIVSVQEVSFFPGVFWPREYEGINYDKLAANSGFSKASEALYWFAQYRPSKMAIIHFTDFRY